MNARARAISSFEAETYSCFCVLDRVGEGARAISSFEAETYRCFVAFYTELVKARARAISNLNRRPIVFCCFIDRVDGGARARDFKFEAETNILLVF